MPRGSYCWFISLTMDNAVPDEFLAGKVLLIDKPLGWSSFQAVNKLKWLLKSKLGIKKIKIGHAGTLDPLASGLLLVCTGKFTKRIEELQGQPKEYTGTFTLGSTTPSYDLETQVDRTFPVEHITPQMIHAVALQMTGIIMQKPPIFSAIKKDGKRLYEHARAGEEVEIAARPTTIHEFEITNIDMPRVEFRILCSKGTYIRSIAYDFGLALESGAHLTALRRTKIGNYDVADALTPETFETQFG